MSRSIGTLPEIIAAARKAGACLDALEWAESQPDLATAAATIRPEWAYWLRRYVPDLSPEIQAEAERMACTDPAWAYCLRLLRAL